MRTTTKRKSPPTIWLTNDGQASSLNLAPRLPPCGHWLVVVVVGATGAETSALTCCTIVLMVLDVLDESPI